MPYKVGALGVDELFEGAFDALVAVVYVEHKSDLAKGHQIQVVGIVTEKELFVAQQLGQDLEIVLAELFDFLCSVTIEAGGLDLLHALAYHSVLKEKVEESHRHFSAHHVLQVELETLQGVVGVFYSPVHDGPVKGEKYTLSLFYKQRL